MEIDENITELHKKIAKDCKTTMGILALAVLAYILLGFFNIKSEVIESVFVLGGFGVSLEGFYRIYRSTLVNSND